ncbi:TPA: histidinol-phosphate aminotransferase [Providencia rettgeri]|uniref:inositol monophosphatase family protein n=1 Tax=Providencia TaxID=586 RepID=UPI001B913BDE|nr:MULTISPECIES: inositol monophosphatase family protein [Providencia]EMB5786424.1 histidinol-phosphate aminotransferase [Providencia rettgeri]HBC7429219.1 histidinol-phosphate aminotransferase [Providencia rettgeri]
MLNIALEAANTASKYLLKGFYEAGTFTRKIDNTIVTATDLKVENVIREVLQARTPHIPILGEEFGTNIEGEFSTGWIIDPIDGTRAFLYGVPLFSTLIAYVESGIPLVGVISFSAIDSIYYASLGNGCWSKKGDLAPKRICTQIKKTKKLGKAVVSISGIHSTNFDNREGNKAYNLSNVVNSAQDMVFINDCYQHLMVAAGRIDCAIDTLMKPWDIAAILPCLTEAGVYYANINGNKTNVINGGSLVSASSSELLDELIVALNS